MSHTGIFSGHCKLVVTDIDFTFVGADKALVARNLEAMEAIRRAGIPCAIATGRYWKGIRDLVAQLGLTTPQIVDNGATLIQPGDERVILSHPIGGVVSRLFYDSLRQDGLYPIVGTPRDYFSEYADEKVVEIMKIHSEYSIVIPEAELRQLLEECVKQTLYVEDGRIPLLHTAIDHARQRAAAAGLPLGGFFTEAGIFTLNAAGVDKLGGVQDLCQFLGCSLDDVLAVGDGDNDAAMLQACGIGCAVANATPRAKAAASRIVSSCEQAGFADAVFSLLS